MRMQDNDDKVCERIPMEYRNKYSSERKMQKPVKISIPTISIQKAELEPRSKILESKLSRVFNNGSAGKAFIETSTAPVPQVYLSYKNDAKYRLISRRTANSTGNNKDSSSTASKNMQIYHSSITIETLGLGKKLRPHYLEDPDQIKSTQMIKKKLLAKSFKAGLSNAAKKDQCRVSSYRSTPDSIYKSNSSTFTGIRSGFHSRVASSRTTKLLNFCKVPQSSRYYLVTKARKKSALKTEISLS